MNIKQFIIIGMAILLFSVSVAYANGTISNITCTANCNGFGNSSPSSSQLSYIVAYNDTEQSNLTNGDFILLNFNTVRNDTKGEWNTITSEFMAKESGRYLVTGKALFMYTVANRDYIVYVQKNRNNGEYTRLFDGIYHASAINSAAGLTAQFFFIEDFKAGESFKVYVQSNAGNNQVAIGGYCLSYQLCDERDRAYYSVEIVQLTKD